MSCLGEISCRALVIFIKLIYIIWFFFSLLPFVETPGKNVNFYVLLHQRYNLIFAINAFLSFSNRIAQEYFNFFSHNYHFNICKIVWVSTNLLKRLCRNLVRIFRVKSILNPFYIRPPLGTEAHIKSTCNKIWFRSKLLKATQNIKENPKIAISTAKNNTKWDWKPF